MFVLMLLNERRGKSHYSANTYKDLGLAGAMILDLGFKGKLSISGQKSRIVDYHACGDPIIDKILVFLCKSKRPLKLRPWIRKIARFYKEASKSLYQRLENYGILTSGFKTKRYYFIKPEAKQTLLEQVKHGMIDDMNPDLELLCLLGLIHVSGFLDECIEKEYRKYVRRRINRFIHSTSYGLISKVINMTNEISNRRARIAGSGSY